LPLPIETNGSNENGVVTPEVSPTPHKGELVEVTESPLTVDISDALSEREKVKFTVHTKTTLPEYNQRECTVIRQHEEFIWLHDCFQENEDYAGYIIPPPPPKPDFDASREKLQRLGDGEGSLTAEEFAKMKAELEAEYLAIFKKTVAMHEVFLSRLAQHAVFRGDTNLRVFLEYADDLSVRTRNKKERVSGLLRSLTLGTDAALLAVSQRDVDSAVDAQRRFLAECHTAVRDAAARAQRAAQARKSVAEQLIGVAGGIAALGTAEGPALEDTAQAMARHWESARKVEGHLANDEDLKLTDTLRYYQRETSAARDLLYRRLRSLADYEQANKTLDRARAKNRHVHAAELAQQNACERFEMISERAAEELVTFRARRVAHYRRNLTGLAELELRHARAQLALLQGVLAELEA